MTVPVAYIGNQTAQGEATWQAIAELAERVPIDQWVAVGGQMVAVHAALAGFDPPRVTDDGDVVVDVRTAGRDAMGRVARTLVDVGFTVLSSPDNVTRFVRGQASIDLLAPEGIGAKATTGPPGHAVQAPDATQAIARRRLVTVDWVHERTTISCPSLLGAIIAKAAGSKEIISLTSNERLKHQGDFVFLLSLATIVDPAQLEAAELTAKDRKRLRLAIAPILADAIHPARRYAANFDDAADLADELLGG
jgi:hypothetical protein